MKIERILIEDQMAPIGLDEKKPAFSWLLTAEEGEQNLMQSACRIVVRTGEDTVWDSGKMKTGVSTGIGYEGEALQPCTKYEVKAEVWDNHGGKAEAEIPRNHGDLRAPGPPPRYAEGEMGAGRPVAALPRPCRLPGHQRQAGSPPRRARSFHGSHPEPD